MHKTLTLVMLFASVLAGCTALQPASEVQSGRFALLTGNPDVALTHFRRAAEADPNYTNRTMHLNEGVWAYTGRAYYETGKFAEAREALKQALSRNDNDFMARLYFGLVLHRLPDVPKSDKALSLQDIVYALRERVSSKRLAALVDERGVNFAFTEPAEKELRQTGAENELVEQVKMKSQIKSRLEENVRQQSLKEIERSLKEMDKWLAYVISTPQGRFWDPGGKITSQIKTSLAMIASKKDNLKELINDLEWLGKAVEEESDKARRDEELEKRREQRR